MSMDSDVWTVTGELLSGAVVHIRSGCTKEEANKEAELLRRCALFPQIRKERQNDETVCGD